MRDKRNRIFNEDQNNNLEGQENVADGNEPNIPEAEHEQGEGQDQFH